MKKIMMILTAALLMATIVGCASDKKDATETTAAKSESTVLSSAASSEASTTSQDATASDASASSAGSDAALETGAEGDDFATQFLLDDAKNVMAVAGNVAFTSEKSLEEAQAFYKEVIATLKATGEEETMDINEDKAWIWTGTYGDAKVLVISVTSNSAMKTTAISVNYGA